MSETNEVKRGRGRPPIYTGAVLIAIVALCDSIGLTNARKVLNSGGAVRKMLASKFGVTVDAALSGHKLGISMPTLCKLHERHGSVKLHRGRPVLVKEAA